MIELTEQQQLALDTEPSPARVIDPRTRKAYVLVDADQFEKVSDLLAPGPLTERERQTILQGVWNKANWDDPRMDAYDTIQPSQEP